MSERSVISRRQWLQGVALGAAVVGLPGLTGCKKELDCTDTAGLTDVELAMRNAQAYSDKSPEPTKSCSGCQLFVASAPNQCGTCKLLKGPVNPAGYCKSWAAKPV